MIALSPLERRAVSIVVAQHEVGTGLFELWFEHPGAAQALPGQFVHVRCGEGLLRRPFSIYRVRDPHAALLYQVVGLGTRWMARLQPGATLDVLGPLGSAFTPPRPGDRTLLVGGGVGMAPLARFAACHPDAVARVMAGFRSKHHVCGTDPFREGGQALTIHTEDGSEGLRGRPTDDLAEIAHDLGATRILTCGPEGLMASVAAIARELGIPCEAAIERPMGCGIGICLACVVPARDRDGGTCQARACTEGPVFDAARMTW